MRSLAYFAGERPVYVFVPRKCDCCDHVSFYTRSFTTWDEPVKVRCSDCGEVGDLDEIPPPRKIPPFKAKPSKKPRK